MQQVPVPGASASAPSAGAALRAPGHPVVGLASVHAACRRLGVVVATETVGVITARMAVTCPVSAAIAIEAVTAARRVGAACLRPACEAAAARLPCAGEGTALPATDGSVDGMEHTTSSGLYLIAPPPPPSPSPPLPVGFLCTPRCQPCCTGRQPRERAAVRTRVGTVVTLPVIPLRTAGVFDLVAPGAVAKCTYDDPMKAKEKAILEMGRAGALM